MKNDLLTFEVSSDGYELDIHGDPKSLRLLAETFMSLAEGAENGEFPHYHFFSPTYGGDDLSMDPQTSGFKCVDHVKIYGWPDNRGAAPYNKKTKEPT